MALGTIHPRARFSPTQRQEMPLRFAPKKTAAMVAVLIAGLGIALLGFTGQVIPFGVSIVLCFLVWIIGARLVHMAFRVN